MTVHEARTVPLNAIETTEGTEVGTQMDAAAIPLISAVVPTHDVAPWIRDCLGSVLRQGGEELEVIVVDDHSEDGSVEIIEAIAASDARVRIVRAQERGGANARNLGVTLARGEYLVFADGDDLVPDGAYAAMLRSLEESGSDMAVGNFLKFSAKETWEPAVNWRVLEQPARGIRVTDRPALIRGRACWNKVFRRSFWHESRIVFPEVARSNDIVPMVRALTSARSIDVVTDFVYLYRERPGGRSMTSRAGEAASLLSYLDQEIRCVEMILALRDDATLREYFSMFLRADGWVHLTKFSSASTGGLDAESASDLARLVRTLIAAAPEEQLVALEPWRRRCFELFGEGHLDIARHFDVDGTLGNGPVVAEPDAYRAVIRSTEIAMVTPGLEELAVATLRKKFARPLLAVADGEDDETLAELAQLTAEYRRRFIAVEILPFWPAERDVVRMCEEGRVDDIRRLSRVLHSATAEVAAVRPGPGGIYLEVDSDGPDGSFPVGVRFKRRRSGHLVDVSLDQDAVDRTGRFSVTVTRSMLPKNGVWDAFVLTQDGGAVAEIRLRLAARTSQVPAGRSPRFVMHRVRRAGHAFVVERRTFLAVRGLAAARRRVRAAISG